MIYKSENENFGLPVIQSVNSVHFDQPLAILPSREFPTEAHSERFVRLKMKTVAILQHGRLPP